MIFSVTVNVVAINAARSVVGKALAPITDGLLETWAASAGLGRNIDALKTQLLCAQGMLESAQGRDIHNSALEELLLKLRQLAYGADDALDELEYFRIQDALDGTYHAAAVHAGGCLHDLALKTHHTAKAVANKLKLPLCRRAVTCGDLDDQENDGTQGCLSSVRSCDGGRISSSPPSPANQGENVDGRCMPTVACKATYAIGKHFPCYFSVSAGDNHALQTNHDIQTPKLKFDRVEMSKKLMDITQQLKPVCDSVSTVLNLELSGSSRIPSLEIGKNRPETTPAIIEPKLYGRDDKKRSIVDGIANGEYHANELTVLPIIGPGGIGKTTFIQHIYDEVKSCFDVSIWICVSLNFSANRLAQEIVKKIPKVDGEKKHNSDEERIKERLRCKSFLLVLDDMWSDHEDEWKRLLVPFKKVESKGNMIIVTTRMPKVANMVRTTDCSVELESLDPKSSMFFFEACIFGRDKPWGDLPVLHDVGNKIVPLLKGSPLAIKTVGRLLRKNLTLDHWIRVLESKEWKSQTNDNDIMPALKLSYDYLPFYLQQCLSFCGLFPEDYEFDSKKLVHLWVGLGIMPSHNPTEWIEDVGFGYLEELVNHGFFKKNKKENACPSYVIHDLLHELAVKISSYECLSINSSNVRSVQIPSSVRHLSIIVEDKDVSDRTVFQDYNRDLGALDKKLNVENLHTLMLFGKHHGSFAKTFGDLFRGVKALRTIILSEASYSLKDILHNLSKTIHLRYIRIRSMYNRDLDLPKMLFRFYHLEIIDLEQWSGRFVSTGDMNNLIKLLHFLVPEDEPQLHSDISKVGKLKFLLELRRFEVGKDETGFELSQLGQLTELRGSLSIHNLEKVQEKVEINELKPIHRNHLHKLTLEWDMNRSYKDPTREDGVLESLVPQCYLQDLCIKGHGGTNCPTWLGENLCVRSLVSLHLGDVSWKTFPPLGELWFADELGKEYQACISSQSFQNLKRLELVKIPNLTRWVGSKTCQLFSHLEVLIIEDCPELTELPFSCSTCYEPEQERANLILFPTLREFNIARCPKLTTMPPIPWSRALRSIIIAQAGSSFQELAYLNRTLFVEWGFGFRKLSGLSLVIKGMGGVDSLFWNGLAFCNLSDLKNLSISNCPPLASHLQHIQMLTSLETLAISDSDIVVSPIGDESHVTYPFPVKYLRIWKSRASGKELTRLLSHFPKLTYLRIGECENIRELGVVEQQTGPQRQQTQEEQEIAAAAEGQERLLLPTQLHQLEIVDCPELRILSNSGGDNNTAAEGGLQRLRSLCSLSVEGCPKLLSSDSSSCSSCCPFPTSLERLDLSGLEGRETFEALSNLTSLTRLSIIHCEDVRGEGIWPLVAQGNLTELHVGQTPKFFVGFEHEQELLHRYSKLKVVTIQGPAGVLSVPICSLLSSSLTKLTFQGSKGVEPILEEALPHLTSLQQLQFDQCSHMQFLPAGLHRLASLKILQIQDSTSIRSLPGLPSSLQELHITSCSKFKLLAEEGLPSSLQILGICDCPSIKLLPKDGLPRSLQILGIRDCPSIKLLPKDAIPSSLQELRILGCPAIKSLPMDRLPSSLRVLEVCDGNSEELKRQCRKLTGTIPIIRA